MNLETRPTEVELRHPIRRSLGIRFGGRMTRQSAVTVVFVVLVGLFCRGVAFAQERGVAVGYTPPPLDVQEWVQGDVPSLALLHGKVVIIELWGTWCSPCVGHIPKWNTLAKAMSGRDVVFVSIALDEHDRLVAFLKDHPRAGVVGADPARRVYTAYGLPGVGSWVLVGRDGKVAGITEPENVDEQAVNRLLENGVVTLPSLEMTANLDWDEQLIGWQDGVPPLTQAIIKPINTRTGGLMHVPGSNRLVADGVGLRPLLCFAYEIETEQLDLRVPELEQQYRVSVIVPPTQAKRLRPLLAQALLSSVGVTTGWEDRQMDVYVIRRLEGVQPRWGAVAQGPQTMMASGSRMMGKRQPMGALRAQLDMVLGRFVVDETGLTGLGDWDIEVRKDKPETIGKSLEAQLGVRVEPGRRVVKVLVVEPSRE
jgi:uncharacterized protein (TIGR03435 family)